MKTKGYRPSAPLPHELAQSPQGTLDQLEEGATQGAQALVVRSAVIVERGAPLAAPRAQQVGTEGVTLSDESAWLAWSQQTLVLQTETSDVELPVPLVLYRLCLAWVERREARALDPQDGRVLLQVQGAAAQGVPGLVELLSAMFKLHLAELPRQAMRIVREHAAKTPASRAAEASTPGQQSPPPTKPGDESDGKEGGEPPASQEPSAPERALASPVLYQGGDAETPSVPAPEGLPPPRSLEISTSHSEAQSVFAQGDPETAEPRRERAADRRRRRGPPID